MNHLATSTSETDVLIAGAGPTGLMLALWLTRLKVRVRIVDPKSGPTVETRAIVVQARTLEFYDQLGLGDEARARGQHFDAFSLWVRSKEEATVSFSDVATDLTPHPRLNTLTQDQNEDLLVAALRVEGVEVEWGSQLTDFTQDGTGVTARLEHGKEAQTAVETLNAHYLAGCDGGRSLVRHKLGLGFTGGTSSGTFFVADTEARGTFRKNSLNVLLSRDAFFVLFPMKGANRQRIVGIFPEDEAEAHGFEAVRPQIEASRVVSVEKVHWFSLYRVHHRVAEHFRRGRTFVLGDAGHVHSPLGGQGMNTGLGDAVNLAWKLAQALRYENEALLDSYEAERMPFARALVASTDRAFGLISSPRASARALRTRILPAVLGPFTYPRPIRLEIFLRLSQLRIRYPQSPLSEGQAGRVRGGERLPWVRLEDSSNFDTLKSLEWQLHVYGKAPISLESWCRARALPLHVLPFTPAARHAGLAKDALYLVRPDGYIGLALPTFREEELTRYVVRWVTSSGPPAVSEIPQFVS